MLLADFDALATGLLQGTPIARDGRRTWKFVLLVAKADEEARCNVFGLPHWGTPEPCPECLCNRDLAGRPYIFVYVIFLFLIFFLLDSQTLFAFYCYLLEALH